ncbi:MAG: hypothetical protein ACI3WQ_06960 [Faecousia sp.]
MEKQLCDQCENRCPVDALQCGKGRRHFGLESAEDGRGAHGRQMLDGPLGLLMKCGHFLHHGGAEGENLLQALSPADQAELERILTALLSDWKNRMPGGGHDHSHHGR